VRVRVRCVLLAEDESESAVGCAVYDKTAKMQCLVSRGGCVLFLRVLT
jgi:hypothetical protein